MNGLIQQLLDENKNKLLLLLQDIPKLLKQEWKGVHQSVWISWNTAQFLLNT